MSLRPEITLETASTTPHLVLIGRGRNPPTKLNHRASNLCEWMGQEQTTSLRLPLAERSTAGDDDADDFSDDDGDDQSSTPMNPDNVFNKNFTGDTGMNGQPPAVQRWWWSKKKKSKKCEDPEVLKNCSRNAEWRAPVETCFLKTLSNHPIGTGKEMYNGLPFKMKKKKKKKKKKSTLR
eukprot:Selendium_serpulae@DN6548_c0_g1_i1.p1